MAGLNVLYVEELNWLTLPFALVYRVLGWEVRVIHLAQPWQGDPWIHRMKRWGLVWRNFYDYTPTIDSEVFALSKRTTRTRVSAWLRKSRLFASTCAHYRADERQARKIEQAILNLLYHTVITPLCKTALFLRHDAARSVPARTHLLPATREYAWVSDHLEELSVRVPGVYRILLFLGICYLRKDLILKVTKVLLLPLRRIRESFRARPAVPAPMAGAPSPSPLASLAEKEVLYFPHGSIAFGPFFTKNYYYDAERESPLHPTRMMHIFLEGSDLRTRRYFRRLGAPMLEFLNSHLVSTMSIPELIRFHAGNILRDLAAGHSSLGAIQAQLQVYFLLERSRRFFARYPNIKLVLLGYDQLFPREMNAAFALLGIPVAAAMERGNGLISYGFMNHDHHFVWGPGMISRSEEMGQNRIDRYDVGGLPRLDRLHRYTVRKAPLEGYHHPGEGRRFLVLAFSLHFPSSLYEDGLREHGARSLHIASFYEALLEVGETLDVRIVIRDKENIWPQYQHLDRIRRCPNISFESDVKRYNTYKVIPHADMVVGLSTSLLEETLAAGIPTVFYDPPGFYAFNGFPFQEIGAVATTPEELLERIRTVKEGGTLADPQRQRSVVSRFYSLDNDGQVAARIRGSLRSNHLTFQPASG